MSQTLSLPFSLVLAKLPRPLCPLLSPHSLVWPPPTLCPKGTLLTLMPPPFSPSYLGPASPFTGLPSLLLDRLFPLGLCFLPSLLLQFLTPSLRRPNPLGLCHPPSPFPTSPVSPPPLSPPHNMGFSLTPPLKFPTFLLHHRQAIVTSFISLCLLLLR